MFKNNNTGDFVTREEARTALGELSELAQRVSALESLAAQLRRGQSVSAGGARHAGTLPVRTPFEGVTKAEASEAYSALLAAGKEEFQQLNAKVDRAVAQLRNVSTPQGEYSHSTTEATTVDYGAIAFGLSEIRNKVAEIVGEGAGREHAPYYREAVQYFADVFAKSDPTFDADAFKRQAGIEGGGVTDYERPHP